MATVLAGGFLVNLAIDRLWPGLAWPFASSQGLGLWVMLAGVGAGTWTNSPVTALELTAWTSPCVLGTCSALLICVAVTFRGDRSLPSLTKQARVRFLVLLSAAVAVGAATSGIRGIAPSDA